MSIPNPALSALLNRVVPPAVVFCHMVPTRIIRIVRMDDTWCTFRVEQLIEHGGFGTVEPRGEWRTLSTHGSAIEGHALKAATDAAVKSQRDLIYKLQKRMEARAQMARNGT